MSTKVITQTFDDDTTTTANNAQYNEGDAFSIQGIAASGRESSITLTDQGALKVAERIANNALRTSMAAEQQNTARLSALAALATDAVQGGIEAASANAPARALAEKVTAYAKVAAGIAAGLAALGLVIYLVKRA